MAIVMRRRITSKELYIDYKELIEYYNNNNNNKQIFKIFIRYTSLLSTRTHTIVKDVVRLLLLIIKCQEYKKII
ncbi:MAG TPA: hypothetical protein VE619_07085 [Nitrososphaeraceae archaeon]|nr:hypothetical protein [Nitrososphaeraceae archaeon]